MIQFQISQIKEAAVLLVAFLVVATTGFARDEYSITKITPSLVSSPELGGSKRKSGNDSQWLAVDVDFKATESADELTLNYYMFISGTCVVGESTYVNVEKSRELHSAMYVSPHTLRKLSGGKRVTLNSIENITVRIISKGQPVAEKSLSPARVEWWKDMQQVKGVLVKKSETPFAWIDWDYYEELKPETH